MLSKVNPVIFLSCYLNVRAFASTTVEKSFFFFFAPLPAGSQMHFFDSLSYPLRGQQISLLQNQYMGRFFTPQSGSPSPGEINKMKGISGYTAVRLHNPYFPQGRAAAIDQTLQCIVVPFLKESGPHCGDGTVLYVLCTEGNIWNQSQ